MGVLSTTFPPTFSQLLPAVSDDVLDKCEVVPEVEMAESYEENCLEQSFDMIFDFSQVFARKKRIVNTKGSARNSRPPSSSSSTAQYSSTKHWTGVGHISRGDEVDYPHIDDADIVYYYYDGEDYSDDEDYGLLDLIYNMMF